MAEQAVGTVASAVIGEIADMTLTKVMQKLHSPPAAHEKLLRLELRILKVRSAIEVSDKLAIESASLLEWRDRLREAAAEAGEVLLQFQRRATEEAEAARSAAERLQSANAGAGAGTAGGALYFARSSLSGMAQRMRDAAMRLFSTDEDMKKLDRSLEMMEQLSPDVTQFVMLLQLEVSPKRRLPEFICMRKTHSPMVPDAGQRLERAAKKVAALEEDCQLEVLRKTCRQPVARRQLPSPSQCSLESSHRVTLPDSEQGPRRAVKAVPALEEDMQRVSAEVEDRENEARVLGGVLQQALRRLLESRCNKATEDRDMEGFEWLPQWSAVLREAVERGDTVSKTLFPGSDVRREAGGALEANDELYIFARAVEWLASDVQCFNLLVSLCPWKLKPLKARVKIVPTSFN